MRTRSMRSCTTRRPCSATSASRCATTPPLLGVVSRLTTQKGSDLVAAIAGRIAALPAHLAVLGTGERSLERTLLAAAQAHPGAIAAVVGFDERIAHRIEAGADMFLMPSRFEPSGLNQMYSQRYRTPPVARATGGLIDSIVDATPAALEELAVRPASCSTTQARKGCGGP